jgi:transposase
MIVQVYEDNVMKKTAIYKWVTRFSQGTENVTYEESSGRPATKRTVENIAKVRQILHENCRMTVRSIPEQADIYRKTGKS